MPTKTTSHPTSSKMRPKSGAPKHLDKAAPKRPKAPAKAPPVNASGIPNARVDLDLEHFKSLLLAERARLEAEREHIRSHGLEMEGTLPDDAEGGEEDTADLAAAMMDKEMELSVEDEIEDMLAAVDHAVQKMEDGTYGICDISGDPIPESRLELIPWAALTVQCQAVAEGE